MRTRTISAALVLIAGAATGGCSAIAGRAEAAPVVIGADLALTGGGSPLGTVYHNALQLRLGQLNAQGAAGGRQLVLRVVDNRSDPQLSAANLTELAADPQVTAIIAGACGGCLASVAAQLDAHRVPTISLSADELPAADELGRFLFKLGPNAGDDADLLAEQLTADRRATVALVTVTDAYGQAGRQQLSAASDRGGLQLVLDQRVDPADPATLTRAAATITTWQPDQDPAGPPPGSGPDAVVIWTPAPLAVALADQLRRAGYSGGLYLDAVAAGGLYLAGQALAGARLVFTDTPVADQLIAATPAKAARQTWFRDYLAAHGTYHAQASWAADALSVIADALARIDRTGGQPTRDTLRDTIESTRRLDGLTGLIRFTADQHSGLHPQSLTILTASGGRWHPAS